MQSTPHKSLTQICAAFAEHFEAREAVGAGRSYVPLLPLLEHPPGRVRQQLMAALVSSGVPAEEAGNVSVRELLRYALTADDISARWCSMAVAWIESGFPLDEGLADALERAARNRRHSQKTRHLAFALARRWRRAAVRSSAGNESGGVHQQANLEYQPDVRVATGEVTNGHG